MLKVDTSFKKGILLISIGGDLVKDTVSDLDTIIKLIKNNGFSNVIIETNVKYDKNGLKKLKYLEKQKNVIIV